MEPTHTLGAHQGYKEQRRILLRPSKTGPYRARLERGLHSTYGRPTRPRLRRPIPMAERPRQRASRTRGRSLDSLVLRQTGRFWKDGIGEIYNPEHSSRNVLQWREVHRHGTSSGTLEIRPLRRRSQSPPYVRREAIVRRNGGHQGRSTTVWEIRGGLASLPPSARRRVLQLYARGRQAIRRQMDNQGARKQSAAPLKDYVPPPTDENTPPADYEPYLPSGEGYTLGDFSDWHEFIAGLYDELNQ